MRADLLGDIASFANRWSRLRQEEANLWAALANWITRIDFKETPETTKPYETPQKPRSPRQEPAYLHAREAAARLGISRSTLARLRMAGNGPEFHKVGRRVLYRCEALEAWMAQHVRSSTWGAGQPDISQRSGRKR